MEHGYIVLKGLKIISNSYCKVEQIIAMNLTLTSFTTLSDGKKHGFSIDDFCEQELSSFCDAILENRKIGPCDIEDTLQ